jgi:hypothetical protein
MSIPTFDVLTNEIMAWFRKNYVSAMLPYRVDKEKFDAKHTRINHFHKVWKENGYWLVEVSIEYALGQSQWVKMTFQVDEAGKILGYVVNEER